MARCYVGLEIQTFGDYGPAHQVRARVEEALREHFDPDYDGDIVVALTEYAAPVAGQAVPPVISHVHADRADHDRHTIARRPVRTSAAAPARAAPAPPRGRPPTRRPPAPARHVAMAPAASSRAAQ